MLISRRSALVSATVLAGAALTACATDKTSSEKGTAGSTGSTGLTIVATTGYLGDAARNIAPDATVTVLVGPGGDPHTQELTTKDTQAIESADVTLLGGDLAALVKARDLSVDTMRNIRQNLVFAFVYNVVGIPLAAGALYPAFGWLLSPVIAAAAMALSSVSVITNSLRLRRHR